MHEDVFLRGVSQPTVPGRLLELSMDDFTILNGKNKIK